MTVFYPISTELCLACSGSALSGSQRPRPISKPRSKSSSKEQPSTNAVESNSSLPDDSDRKDELELEYKYELDMSIFRTQCCNRPICSACLASNPRLARYVPCLACLGGVHAVAGPSGSSSSLKHPISSSQKLKQDKELELDTNLNGALRDRDVFVLGNDEEDYSDAESSISGRHTNKTPPPAYSAIVPNTPSPGCGENEESGQTTSIDTQVQSTGGTKTTINGRQREINSAVEGPNATPTTTSITASTEIATKPTPRKHYIQKGDTLRGLALRYGVDGRALCRLNNLPPCTLTTTPHILHTRTTLILPPSAKSLPPGEEESHDYDPERERQIKLEKTAKRLQLITKEADWDVAKAYAVLAQSSSSSSSSSSSASLSADMRTRMNGCHKSSDLRQPLSKERNGVDEKSTCTCTDEKDNLSQRRGTMQERALDAYLEDNTWEARERAEGRGPSSASTSTASPTSHRLFMSSSTPTSRHLKHPTGRPANTKKGFF
ncbi:hypothetical protein ACEPAH_7901 [Sanghuangporus vaninii]